MQGEKKRASDTYSMRVTAREMAALRFVSRSMDIDRSQVLRRFSLDQCLEMYDEAIQVAQEEQVAEVGS
jgi:hypothetical protein